MVLKLYYPKWFALCVICKNSTTMVVFDFAKYDLFGTVKGILKYVDNILAIFLQL